MSKSENKSKSKPKSQAPAAEEGLKIKPVKDLEPDASQSENVRGGIWGLGGAGSGVFSDAALKIHVAPIGKALVKLRELRI